MNHQSLLGLGLCEYDLRITVRVVVIRKLCKYQALVEPAGMLQHRSAQGADSPFVVAERVL